ncbi:YciI family protein [Polyangium aurulentum]|uniref:YciI family protein n=1 Tax=Polyangium aurulentum TaxID=2567896 RepID=UPI0010ADD605|nr:YciI family protein [Polyangium aurulentum]UQA60645.1 dehydrogenase [Polyangium aurulentum]
MRFIITAAPDPNAPKTDTTVDEQMMAAYMKYNEDMHKAGVLVASEGLNPASQGARIGISGGKRVVLDGPFVETKELVGGFYLIEVKSREEAIEWALRCPVGLGTADVLTIHQMTEASDIPPEMMKIIEQAAPTWSASFRKGK